MRIMDCKALVVKRPFAFARFRSVWAGLDRFHFAEVFSRQMGWIWFASRWRHFCGLQPGHESWRWSLMFVHNCRG